MFGLAHLTLRRCDGPSKGGKERSRGFGTSGSTHVFVVDDFCNRTPSLITEVGLLVDTGNEVCNLLVGKGRMISQNLGHDAIFFVVQPKSKLTAVFLRERQILIGFVKHHIDGIAERLGPIEVLIREFWHEMPTMVYFKN